MKIKYSNISKIIQDAKSGKMRAEKMKEIWLYPHQRPQQNL